MQIRICIYKEIHRIFTSILMNSMTIFQISMIILVVLLCEAVWIQAIHRIERHSEQQMLLPTSALILIDSGAAISICRPHMFDKLPKTLQNVTVQGIMLNIVSTFIDLNLMTSIKFSCVI